MRSRMPRLSIALILTILAPLVAQAVPSIQVGTMALDPPTLNSLGIVVPITAGDDDYDAQATVQFRITGATSWRAALPLLRVRPDTVGTETPPGDYGLPMPGEQFAGSIMGLDPGVTYDIQVTVTDPDGGGGTQSATIQTGRSPCSSR
ncbi:MAG: hypothetical protein HC807_05620 [Gammaproteobacteria bacterium]|nr:hypothetical protein [Gammaproteobacteria bacterium]